MRSYAPGFIFTTALPPAICSAATAAIRHLKTSNWERERHQDRAARVKAILTAAGLPVMSSDTHIVPLFVGDPEKCKRASDMLLEEHGIYIQPINYPTVAKGTERLRITPSPYHDDGLIDALAEALLQVWERLGLPLNRKVAGGGITLTSLPAENPDNGPRRTMRREADPAILAPCRPTFKAEKGEQAAMLHDWGVIAAAFGYIGLLFFVASRGDRLSPGQRGRAGMLIYPLSLAIYCTSWTFFGSVGFATRTSVDFLAIYVGPILMIGFCTPILRRVIALAKSQNITSIADFIGARYGKSQAVAATVAMIAIIGSVPYIALQLKAMASSLETILIEDKTFSSIPIIGDIALW